jgi:hypothetical protein
VKHAFGTLKRVAFALLLASSVTGLALVGGGAPVSHAATAPTISASSPVSSGGWPIEYEMQVTGSNFTPGGRVWLGFYTSQGQFVTSMTVTAWAIWNGFVSVSTQPVLPGCQTDRVVAYDYTKGLYSNWSSTYVYCIP